MSRTGTATFGENPQPRFTDDALAPWSILLAGGNGSRLSQLIRAFHSDERPKQFATLIGRRSMLQHTWARALALSPPDRIMVLLTGGQEGWAKRQLPPQAAENFVVQPQNIGTGPAICLAIAKLMIEAPQASVVIYPSDHFIWPEDKFQKCVSAALDACNAAGDPKIVILGAEPTDAKEGMGWLLPGKPIGQIGETPLFTVERFVEKPSPERAKMLLDGGALWNTFIMVGRVRSFWYLLWKKHTEAARRMELFCQYHGGGVDFDQAMGAFKGLDAFDFSREVLQQASDDLLLCPLYGVRWQDWGTPEGFFETVEAMRWTEKVDQKLISSELKKPHLGEYRAG